ncbi:MAG TPA: 4Fe-4S binding protein [Chloroflexota bacterium]
MRFRIVEEACINCGACRRYCPVDCIPYDLQHQIDQARCVGCVICYAVCPADAVAPVAEERGPSPDLSWTVVKRVMLAAYRRGPRGVGRIPLPPA